VIIRLLSRGSTAASALSDALGSEIFAHSAIYHTFEPQSSLSQYYNNTFSYCKLATFFIDGSSGYAISYNT
jgi:hypothetical protein